MFKKYPPQLAIALALLAPAWAPAQGSMPETTDNGYRTPAGASLTQGEVRKVDKAAGKVTLKHGEIKNLDMAAMTMVFRVQDPALLDQLKEGDKIRFAADKVGGALTLTKVEPAR